jgi:hypothetical protein
MFYLQANYCQRCGRKLNGFWWIAFGYFAICNDCHDELKATKGASS